MYYLLLLLVIAGCANITAPVAPTAPTDTMELVTSEYSVDPYELSTVRKVTLRLAKTAVDTNKINPTHYYVSFRTKGNVEAGKLYNWDKNIIVQEFPLDKKIVQHGFDRSLPDSVRVFYCAVPVNYKFCPGIKYKILKELVLPEEGVAKTICGISQKEIEYQCLKLSGDKRIESDGLAKTAVFTPTGTIKYWDNSSNTMVPCAHARVTYGYWYSWKSVRLDANGSFRSTTGYNWGVDYHLHFDSDDFEFKNYGLYEGPHGVKRAFNVNFANDIWALSALCFDGCWEWWYGYMWDLGLPHQNKIYNFRVGINIYNRQSENYGGMAINIYSVQWADIFCRTTKGEPDRALTSQEMYETIMHEISHSSYMSNYRTREWWLPLAIELLYVDISVIESYAVGIQYLTNERRYNTRWNYRFFKDYTGIMVDLVDDDIRYVYHSPWEGYEYVDGYTIGRVGLAFYRSKTWDELKENVWNDPPMPRRFDRDGLDRLFSYWINYKG
jgi:hypothetical protein